MLSRAFDHICIEKARYKILIIITQIAEILQEVVEMEENAQCYFDECQLLFEKYLQETIIHCSTTTADGRLAC